MSDHINQLERALEQATVAIDGFVQALKPGPLKICRDCKWSRWPQASNSTCEHTEALGSLVDLVTGKEIAPWLYCLNMRTKPGAPCGVEARLFEPREATNVPVV